MDLIVAVDKKWGIGKNNDLLAHLPGDLKYYKEKTRGKCVIFGRRTLESLPGSKPLPDRNHIVLSNDPNFEIPLRDNMKECGEYKCILCHTKEEVLEAAKSFDEVFICGGASLYELFLDYVDAIYVTWIDHSFDADRFFPDLDKLGYTVTWESEPQEEAGYRYTFRKYEKL